MVKLTADGTRQDLQPDWLTKFHKTNEKPENMLSQQVHDQRFEKLFTKDDKLTPNADLVLDDRVITSIITDANNLLLDSSRNNKSALLAHEENFNSKEEISTSVEHGDLKKLTSLRQSRNKIVKSGKIPEDDLDI